MTFRFKKMAGIGLALASALTLAGCYDDGYGYGGVSVGYGSGGYYGYDDPWYGGHGYGYPARYGWYDGFYYPGSGYWIYDRGGNRHRWSDRHRRHWEGRHEQLRNRDRNRENAGNWQGRPRDGNWRGREARPDQPRPDRQRGWRGERGDRQAAPAVDGRGMRGDRGWRGDRGGRGEGGAATPPARVERSAPGPMGHVFDRRRRGQ